MTDSNNQFIRKWSLIVADATGKGIDLSQLKIKFTILQSDEESPNTANIRVYNLSHETINQITALTPVEYNRVILQAGYKGGNFGVIFDGTIRQFRKGRENNINSYLDILAAEGDIPYNFSYVSDTLSSGWKAEDVIERAADAMGLKTNIIPNSDAFKGINPRGKVLFSLSKLPLRSSVQAIGSTWSINNGVVQVIPLQGYLSNEAVVLTAKTGLIGVPEQTDDGIKLRCLLNPKIIIGARIKIDNKSINQFTQQSSGMAGQPSAAPVGQFKYNSISGDIQLPANIDNDGYYRVYVAEYVGDTRSQDWYTEITALAIDDSTKKVIAKN